MRASSGRWRARVELALGRFRLDLELAGGPRPMVVVGPNGSGKSTLLRTLAGGHRPRRGRIEVEGQVWLDAEAGVDLRPEDRRVGFVPQGSRLFPHLSVIDNVAFGIDGRLEERRRRAAATLEHMGCLGLTERPVSTLSGGEAQRVALARALILEPALLLLDEPLSAVDLGARRGLRTIIAQQASLRPALVVTHDPRDIVAFDADVAVLEEGRLAQLGTADEVARRPATPLAEELFEGWGASMEGGPR